MNIAIIVFYVVIIGAMMYFMAIKPQKKEQKRQQELMDSMEIGDQYPCNRPVQYDQREYQNYPT